MDSVAAAFNCVMAFLEDHDGAMLVLFTAALVASTVLLWRATIRLAKGAEAQAADMKTSIDLAEKQFLMAGQAADLAAKQHGLARHEYFSVHRPKLEVLHLEFSTEVLDGDPKVAASGVYVNAGLSVARNIQIHAKITTLLAPTPGIQIPELGGVRADRESGVRGEFLVTSDISCEAQKLAERDYAQRPGPRVHCLGTITYDDVLGNRRETGFCRVLNPHVGQWSKVDNPEYEYAF
jgi:hypothetical protein